MIRFLTLAAMLSAALLAPAAHAASLPDVAITTCGQVVPNKTLAYLTGDLDCTGFTGGPPDAAEFLVGGAVYLGRKSRLDLRGFTITGGEHGVLCDARICHNGKQCTKGPCEVFNGTLISSAFNANGILGERPVVHDLTISGFYFGVVSLSELQLTHATVSHSGGAGVVGKKLTLVDATVTNNAFIGVDGWTDHGHGVRLDDSTVTGNGTSPLCIANQCADVAGMREPRLRNSSCTTSVDLVHGGTWGVCSGD